MKKETLEIPLPPQNITKYIQWSDVYNEENKVLIGDIIQLINTENVSTDVLKTILDHIMVEYKKGESKIKTY